MEDVARLGFDIESQPISKASGELDRLTAAGKRAEDQATGLGNRADAAGKKIVGANDNAARSAERLRRQNELLAGSFRMITRAAVTLGAAFLAMASTRFLSGAIEAASDLNETVSKTATIFGSSSDAMMKWASNSAQAMGLSKQAALEAASTMGNMFVQLGSGSETAGQISRDMTQLAADIASFNNVAGGAAAVSNAMQSAFRGEYDSLQRYIPTINAATVQLEALRMTGKANAKQLTALDKALAAQKLIMEGAGVAAGDFARTSSQLANQQRIAAANTTDLSAKLGEAFKPAATATVQAYNDAVVFLSENLDTIAKLAKIAGVTLFVAFAPALLGAMASGFVALGIAGVTAIRAITIAIASNPIGALAVGITLAAAAVWQFRDTINQALGVDVVGIAKSAANLVINSFAAAFADIKFVWQQLPNVMSAVIVGAVNVVAAGTEKMINFAIAGINRLIGAVNSLPDWLKPEALENISPIGEFSVGRMDNPAAAALGDANQWHELHVRSILARDNFKGIGDAASDASGGVNDMSGAIAAANDNLDGSGKAAKEAAKALKKFQEEADKLVEKHFPQQAAEAKAEELIRLLDKFGDKLTDIQKKAIGLEIDELFDTAANGAREAAKTVEETLGSVLSDLFKGPIEDVDEFFDKILSGFASLGQANLSKFFDGFLTGGKTAANDNQPNPWAGLTKAVERGAAVGTESGASKGIEGLAGLFSGGGSNPLSGKVGGVLSAGLGGAGIGYETQSPIMGGLGGALSGFMAAGPIGAVVGGIFGILGGIFGRAKKAREEQEKAQKAIEENRGAIDNFLAAGLGQGLGVAQAAERKFLDQGREFRATAEKAGDRQLVNDLDRAMTQMSNLLRNDFVQAFNGTIESLEAGLGSNSPFTQAQNSIVALREELLNFIADTQWAGQNVERARKATQDYALSLLGAQPELTDVEEGLQRIAGTAAGLGNTLLQLGMSASDAANSIQSGLRNAIAELRKDFDEDLSRSINDLAGNSYLNEIADAQDRYNERLRDAAALGLGAERANHEYALALAEIASQAGLSATQLSGLGSQFGASTQIIDDAQAALLTFRDLSGQIRTFLDSLVLNSSLSTLSPQDRLSEARRQFEDVAFRAGEGDVEAQGQLEAVSRTYLEEAKGFHASTEEYAAIFDTVRGTLTGIASSAMSEAEVMARQTELMTAQIGATSSVTTSVDSLASRIAQDAGVTHAQLAQIAANTAQPAPVVVVAPQLPGQTHDANWWGNPSNWSGRFATGGYTGDMGRNAVAGVVHGQEFVAHAEATRRWRPQLEAMNAGQAPSMGGGSDRENFRELGRMISAAVAAQTDALKAEIEELREQNRKSNDALRRATEQKPRLTANGKTY